MRRWVMFWFSVVCSVGTALRVIGMLRWQETPTSRDWLSAEIGFFFMSLTVCCLTATKGTKR